MGQIPIYLNSEKIRILIVGGGKIAYRKCRTLVEAGGQVTVIAQQLLPEFEHYLTEQQISLHKRLYELGEAAQYELVIAATNQTTVNEQIQQDSQAIICRVDDAKKGNGVLPAVVQRGDFVLSIGTNGASPIFSRKIKKQLSQQFDAHYESYIAFLQHVRVQYRGQKEVLEEVTNEIYVHMTDEERNETLQQFVNNLFEERN